MKDMHMNDMAQRKKRDHLIALIKILVLGSGALLLVGLGAFAILLLLMVLL